MSNELKACPFCGNKCIWLEDIDDRGMDRYYAVCMSCGAKSGYEDTPEEAMKKWNARAECEGAASALDGDRAIWIHAPRGNGKTTRLIEMAERDDLYIIVRDENRKAIIRDMAKRMGKNIRNPVALHECRYGNCAGTPYIMTHKGVLVDDSLDVLEVLLGARVVGAVANEPGWVVER